MKYAIIFLFFPLLLPAQPDAVRDDSLQEIETAADTAFLSGAVAEEEYNHEPYTAPPIEPIALREPPANVWAKAAEGMDYSEDVPKPPKERKKREPNEPAPDFDWTGLTQGLGNFLQVLAVVFALCVIGYGIYWMMLAPRNRTISRDGTEITLANLDEYIHETDLERYLREALAASNWPLAVRLYFLQTIKQLSEKEAIVWSKDKTNRDYLREMRNHPLGALFRDVTRQYERVWYGNQSLAAEEFERMEPAFKALLGEL